MPNFENINKVIDWLNRGAPEVIFSMRYSLHPIEDTDVENKDYPDDNEGYYALAYSQRQKVDAGGCGSVCCIAGAAAQFDGAKPDDHGYTLWSSIQDRALQYFGINPKDYDDLPWMLPVFDPHLAPPNCDPITAAAALKRWADNTPFDIAFNPWSKA